MTRPSALAPIRSAVAAIAILSFAAGPALAGSRTALRPTIDPDDPAPSDTLLGDAAGIRPFFSRFGVSFDASEIAEAFATVTPRRTGAGEGLLSISTTVDLDRLAGLQSTKVNVSGYLNQGGPGLTAKAIGGVADVSDLEMKPGSGLYEAWIEHSFGSSLSLRAGRMSAEEEFFVAEAAAPLVNGAFSWASLTMADLPNNGPTPARAAARLSDSPSPLWTWLVGFYSGSDPDRARKAATRPGNPHEPFGIVEIQRKDSEGDDAPTSKVGLWASNSRGPLAALYAVRDTKADVGVLGEIGLFARAMATLPGAMPVTASFTAGASKADLFGTDTIAVGLLASRVRPDGAGRRASWQPGVEATYQRPVRKGWTIQPDAQMLTSERSGDGSKDRRPQRAVVVGVRSTMDF